MPQDIGYLTWHDFRQMLLVKGYVW